MKLLKNCLKALALVLCLFVGIVTLVNFFVNLKAMLLLDFAFRAGSDSHEDFESLTQLMTARAVWHDWWKSADLSDSDFYKITFMYVFANSQIVFFGALIEVALVNFVASINVSDWLDRIPNLPKNINIVNLNIFFCLVALVTPVIFLLSKAAGGF